MPFPSVFTVASWPAFSRTMIVETICASLSRLPVDAGLGEPGHEVVARFAAPLRDQRDDVVAELRRGGGGRLGLRRGGVELVHLHHRVRPVEEVAAAVGRHAEQPADDRDRVGLGEVAQQLEPLAGEELVRQVGTRLA
jgi:hypothetical protein